MTREEAYNILMEAGKHNPGKWIDHSLYVAVVAERIAEKLGLDTDKAYSYSLMHDIGRIKGITGTRHPIDGYNYLLELGYEEEARYAITHSFIVKNVKAVLGKQDMTEEEEKFVQDYLDNVEYDIYDKLVQMGDCMAIAEGITTVERRLIDVYLRYSVDERTLHHWKGVFKIQAEIEDMLGHSIYVLFPEVADNLDKHLVKDILTI